MDKEKIKEKFGEFYIADDYSFIMGIDVRFADHLAKSSVNKTIIETCAGAGFTTISLAKYAKHVYSIEIDATRLNKAKRNSQITGYDKNITFINGDSTSIEVLYLIPNIDSAFIDPDCAIKEDNHIFKFNNSNTEPPSDKLFELIRKRTSNITLVQPPYINLEKFKHLPEHECKSLFLNGRHELYCLHFGDLLQQKGNSIFSIETKNEK